MAFDEGLAQRVREMLEDRPGYSEKKMFGGLCYLANGNMAAGIVGSDLMLRVGSDAYEDCLALEHAREMDFTGRAMKGMIYVGEEGISEDEDLEAWVEKTLLRAARWGSSPPLRAGAPRDRPPGREDDRAPRPGSH